MRSIPALTSIVSFALIAALTSCDPAPAQPVDFRFRPSSTHFPPGGAVLPSRVERGMFFVEVSVDGGEPAWFLLDTGFGVNILTPAFVAASRLSVSPVVGGAAFESSAGADVEIQHAVRLESLAIGDFEVLGVDASVAELAAVQAVLRFEIGGVVGFPTFADALLVLDYPERAARVARGVLEADTADCLPFRIEGGTPFVDAPLGEASLALLVDSGSDAGVAVPAGATVEWEYGPVPISRLATAAGDSARTTFGRLAGDVRLGRHVLSRPIAMQAFGDGHLGKGAMKHFRWTFDQRSLRMRVERDSGAPIEFESWRGIGAGFIPLDTGERVADLVPDGPAETAGLQIGDVVLLRQDVPFEEEPGACGLPHRPDPAVAEGEFLCVQRGAEPLHFTVPVGDLVP